MNMNKSAKLLLISFCLIVLAACVSKTSGKMKQGSKPYVLTTTGMLADAVENILGDKAEVEALMGPGIDPHLFKAKPSDLEKMNKADLIVFSGLHLEGKLYTVLEQPVFEKKAINFSEGIEKSRLLKVSGEEESNYLYDPHIWFDMAIWSEGIALLSMKLQSLYPDWKDDIAKKTEQYINVIGAVDTEIKQLISRIPEEQRVLITSHDAFSYFGQRYGIQVEALQGISTATDFGIQDRKRLVDLIVDRKVNSIFVESSVNPQKIKSVMEDCNEKGFDVVIGGTLYSDAMGDKGSDGETYIDMVRSNAQKIVKGLCANEAC